MTKEEEKYLFWLTSLSGLGLPFVQRFFERYKSIDKARSLSETDIKKAEWMKRETAGCIKTFCSGCRCEKLYAVRTGYGTDV